MVVCKTWAGLIGLGSTLGWALLNFVLGWAQIWAGLKYGLGSIEGHFRQKVNEGEKLIHLIDGLCLVVNVVH